MKNEIILYRLDEIAEHIEVRLEDETVWLTQAQMAILFDQMKQNISLHINNCYKEGDLEKKVTVKDSMTVQMEGQRKVNRKLESYNLDVSRNAKKTKSRQLDIFCIFVKRKEYENCT